MTIWFISFPYVLCVAWNSPVLWSYSAVIWSDFRVMCLILINSSGFIFELVYVRKRAYCEPYFAVSALQWSSDLIDYCVFYRYWRLFIGRFLNSLFFNFLMSKLEFWFLVYFQIKFHLRNSNCFFLEISSFIGFNYASFFSLTQLVHFFLLKRAFV